jgi:hypothetical protein
MKIREDPTVFPLNFMPARMRKLSQVETRLSSFKTVSSDRALRSPHVHAIVAKGLQRTK